MQFARQAYLQQFHELHMRERVEDDNVLQGALVWWPAWGAPYA